MYCIANDLILATFTNNYLKTEEDILPVAALKNYGTDEIVTSSSIVIPSSLYMKVYKIDSTLDEITSFTSKSVSYNCGDLVEEDLHETMGASLVGYVSLRTLVVKKIVAPDQASDLIRLYDEKIANKTKRENKNASQAISNNTTCVHKIKKNNTKDMNQKTFKDKLREKLQKNIDNMLTEFLPDVYKEIEDYLMVCADMGMNYGIVILHKNKADFTESGKDILVPNKYDLYDVINNVVTHFCNEGLGYTVLRSNTSCDVIKFTW
jgi:DNA-binding ferritin-like protein (Dps family)